MIHAMNKPARLKRAKILFRQHGGVLRTSQALSLGIHPRTIYSLREVGSLESMARGVYRLSDLPMPRQPDLVTVSLRVPQAVICLVSALDFHEITTRIPHEIQIALPRRLRTPCLDYPPIRVFRFSGRSQSEGIETHDLGGVRVRVYGVEKTIADCFKFRNKIGLEIAIEALRFSLEHKRRSPRDILRFARICRVERVMTPYVQALA